MRVLGVSIGTRRNGVAVISGTELEVAHIHSICGRWSNKKAVAFLNLYKRYVKRYRITTVIIKIPKPSHFTLALKQLIRLIDQYVKSQGCLIEYMTIEQIKEQEPFIKNRTHLRERVVERFPELLHEKHKDIQNKQPYYMRLFEAVLVADIQSRSNLSNTDDV